MSKIDEDNNQPTLQEGDEERNLKKGAKKASNKGKNVAKKVLKNGKVQAFILAHIPLVIAIVIIIFFIIFLAGFIMLYMTLPSQIHGKLDDIAGGIWSKIVGAFTGDYTTAAISKQDVIDLAQYLEDRGYNVQTYGFGDVEYEEDGLEENNRNGKVKKIKKVGESVDGKKYLLAYMAADENTYVLTKFSLKGLFAGIFGSFMADLDDNYKDRAGNEIAKAQSTGMINISGFDPETGYENASYVQIDRPKKQMLVYTKPNKSGYVFGYDLDNWLARYGRPKELFLAIHLATMMPDLTYKIATDSSFNTKVNVGMQNIDMKFDVKSTKGNKTSTRLRMEELFVDYCVEYCDRNDFASKHDKFMYIMKLLEEDPKTKRVKLKKSDAEIPESEEHWTYNQVIKDAEIIYTGYKGIKDVKWPFIRSVEKHWYYKDFDFIKNIYRFAKKAKKTIDYDPDDASNPLNKKDVTIKLEATLTSEDVGGVIYQVCEPEPKSPNESIKKVFKEKYYKYDGTEITAKKVANSKAIEQGSPTYTYECQKYPVDNSPDMKVEKQKVDFEPNKVNPMMSFGILDNMHTEAADYIYRNLKELVVILKYFEEKQLQNELKKIVLWPIETRDKTTEWETSKDTNNWGVTIKCNPKKYTVVASTEKKVKPYEEITVVAPSDAIVTEARGNSITLKFTKINSGAIKLYNYIYNKRGRSKKEYDFTVINADILTGMKLTISNIKLDSVGSHVKRGDKLGKAISGKIELKMQNVDKSMVEDLADYFDQSHNSKYEELMTKQMIMAETTKGLDIGDFGTGTAIGQSSGISGGYVGPDSSSTGGTPDSSYSGSNGISNTATASGSLAFLTTTTISRDDFIKMTEKYAKQQNKGYDFAKYAGVIYDECVKKGINPVWVAAQAWEEQNWINPSNAQFNFFGYGAFNKTGGSGYGYTSIQDALDAYIKNVIYRINSTDSNDPVYAVSWSKILSQYSSSFNGRISTVYDVFSNYACIDNADANLAGQASHAQKYVNDIIRITNTIYKDYGMSGSKATSASSSGNTLTGNADTSNWTKKGKVSIPVYNQSGQSWSGNAYGGGTISSSGCGACALAMAASGLTGNNITPADIANTIKAGHTTNKTDVSLGGQDVADKYNLTIEARSIPAQGQVDFNFINNALDSGKVLVFSGAYTGSGHYVIVYGRDGNNYYAADSAHKFSSDVPYSRNSSLFTLAHYQMIALGRK